MKNPLVDLETLKSQAVARRNHIYNALDRILNPKFIRHTAAFKIAPGIGFFDTIQEYTKEKGINCFSVDLSLSRLSDYFKVDATTGRFFVAVDSEWLDQINANGGVLILEGTDRATGDDIGLIKLLVDAIAGNRRTPFAANVQLILTYQETDDYQSYIDAPLANRLLIFDATV